MPGSGVKYQRKFWKAQGALGSIREPQERVSEVVGGLWDVTPCFLSGLVSDVCMFYSYISL